MATYGFLAHYTTTDHFAQLLNIGTIGGNQGCWLTPTPYAACMTPYNLGLNTPRDRCLLVDVSDLELWGPGTTPPSSWHPGIWQGGAMEFFSLPVPTDRIVQVYEIMPCGDRHP